MSTSRALAFSSAAATALSKYRRRLLGMAEDLWSSTTSTQLDTEVARNWRTR